MDDQLSGLADDDQLFSRIHDENRYARIIRLDIAVRPRNLVSLVIQVYSQALESAAQLSSQPR